jgi:hypothetical protein
MRRAEIEQENRILLERQRQLRVVADFVTNAWMAFPEVRAVAVIGSVAKPLWKEIPRFREFRRERIEVWHECKDLDLALWVDSQDRLGALRRAAVLAVGQAYKADPKMGIASHHLDIFLFEPGSDRYLGRLCPFNQCPKHKRECLVPGCGAIPFNKRVDGFMPHANILASAKFAMLYERGTGRLRSALDLSAAGQGERASPDDRTITGAAIP